MLSVHFNGGILPHFPENEGNDPWKGVLHKLAPKMRVHWSLMNSPELSACTYSNVSNYGLSEPHVSWSRLFYCISEALPVKTLMSL